MTNEILAGALALAEKGYPVFPLAPGRNIPLIAGGNGHKDAVVDPAQIEAWWKEFPRANVGVSCVGAGILVVDVDPRNGGDESLRDLVEEHGEGWLDTVVALTPREGEHRWYKVPDDARLRPGTPWPGIDIKVGESYVAVPPSKRSDGEYVWEAGRSPFDRELAPPPEWLLARLTEVATKARGPHLAPGEDDVPIVREGGRNNYLASMAGRMHNRGFSPAAVEAGLLAENQATCQPPLEDDEVRRIAASITAYPRSRMFPTTGTFGRPSSADLFSHNSLFSQHGDAAAWPEPPGAAAFPGFVGEVVDAIVPHTEADRVALLANLLVAFGNAVGPGPTARVGASLHAPREFVTLVGRTGKARKGESWNPIRVLFERVDMEWSGARVVSGLSSGEGLIYHVRDATTKKEPIKEKGRLVDYQDVLADEGVSDKRLMVIEPEFARVLRMTERSGNTLSSTIRQAWDSGSLQVLTRTNPLRATDAHVSIIAHITTEELLKELPDVEAANGFANRFIWLAVKRAQLLPDPPPFAGTVINGLASELGHLLRLARSQGELHRDQAAAALWNDIYADLSAEQPGLRGALLARSEAHVLRLSILYALLDASPVISPQHLVAALELWAYAERSVEYIFGDATGNPLADTILKALRAGSGMTRSEISALLGRHSPAHKIALALQQLQASGKATVSTGETGGRPVEFWRAVA